MRAKLQQWAYWVRSSYWFVPALMAVAAIILSQCAIQLDRELGASWMGDVWWFRPNQPEGARALLATVAGSMITVAGVTFSLTILAVSYATSHFGPRLLDNFMRDRGNQVTLGTFVATFLFCLIVLRTIRSGASTAADLQTDLQTSEFVPHFSVLAALALTLASVAILIYYIHHIPESIHISNVLDRISRQLSLKIQELYPESLGEPADPPHDLLQTLDQGIAVHSGRSGYLQGIDETELLHFAEPDDLIVKLETRPGDFLLHGQRIATIYSTNGAELDGDRCGSAVERALAIGISRTPTQDVFFLINQFVEIAERALSPGVNDPLTAIQCIDQLAKCLAEVSSRSMPSRYREDSSGQLRIITTETTWHDLVEHAFGQLIPYVKGDENVTRHLHQRIETLCGITGNSELKRLLGQVGERLGEAAESEAAESGSDWERE